MFIVNSVKIEDDKWKRLSRQIVDLLLAHLQSQNQSLLDIYSTQLTLFDVAFRALNDVLSSVNETRDETFSGGQLQSYCDLIYHHELYVEHFTPITTHYQLLLLFFIEQSDTCT
ncbi:unnamed protein product [Rotaria sp. Silwood1]|nr:unnamed protein product [Rotaria sp. Silwood1]CAF1657522.1 unnamed protein product [Rotaria sp. Silwood1]